MSTEVTAMQEKTDSSVGSVVRGILSSLLVVLLVVFNILLLIKLTCSGLVGDVTKSGLIEEIDLNVIPVGQIASMWNTNQDAFEKNDSEASVLQKEEKLSDVVYDVLVEQEIATDVSKEQVEDLLNSIELDSLLNDVKDDYLKVLLGEQSAAQIKPEQVTECIVQNKDVLEETLDIEITEENLIQVEQYLEDIDIEEITTITFSQENQSLASGVNMVIGEDNTLYIVFGGGIAVICLLLFFVNFKKKRNVFLYTGISAVLAAGAGLALSNMRGQLVSLVVALEKGVLDNILAGVGNVINQKELLFLYVGIGLLLVFVVFEVITRKKIQTA